MQSKKATMVSSSSEALKAFMSSALREARSTKRNSVSRFKMTLAALLVMTFAADAQGTRDRISVINVPSAGTGAGQGTVGLVINDASRAGRATGKNSFDLASCSRFRSRARPSDRAARSSTSPSASATSKASNLAPSPSASARSAEGEGQSAFRTGTRALCGAKAGDGLRSLTSSRREPLLVS